jgi:hypothetical protein
MPNARERASTTRRTSYHSRKMRRPQGSNLGPLVRRAFAVDDSSAPRSIKVEITIKSNHKEKPRDPDARSPSTKGAPLHVKLNPIYKLLKLYNIYYRPLLTTSHNQKYTHSHNTTLIYTPSPMLRQPYVYLKDLQALVAPLNNTPLRQHKPYKTPRMLHLRRTRLWHAPTSTQRQQRKIRTTT